VSGTTEEHGDLTGRGNTQTEVPVLDNSGIRQQQNFLNMKSWL